MKIHALLLLAAIPAFADQALFYNGTPNLGAATDGYGANFLDCSNCRSASGTEVYDDFVVPLGQTWTVDSILGNYSTFTNSPLPTSATWEIATGISQGNGGTVIASGSAAIGLSFFSTPPNGTPTDTYFKATASISPVHLNAGTYWVSLAPTSAANETFLIGTDGTSGVNADIDGVSYANGNGFNYQEVGSYLHPFTGFSNYDFSYGVNGTVVVPEPGAFTLALAGGAVLIWLPRRRAPLALPPQG